MLDSNQSQDRQTEIAGELYDRVARLSRQFRLLELPAKMTLERLSVLSTIQKRGAISVTALADSEMVRPATMSRMISALVDEGLVRRLEDKTDGRGVLVAMTAKGRRACQRGHQLQMKQLGDALSTLPQDQLDAIRELAATLDLLTTALNH